MVPLPYGTIVGPVVSWQRNVGETRQLRVDMEYSNRGVEAVVFLNTGGAPCTVRSWTYTWAHNGESHQATTTINLTYDNSQFEEIARIPLDAPVTATSVDFKFNPFSTYDGEIVYPNYTYEFPSRAPRAFYGSEDSKTSSIGTVYGSVGGKTQLIKKIYGSVNGKTKLLFRGHSSLSGTAAATWLIQGKDFDVFVRVDDQDYSYANSPARLGGGTIEIEDGRSYNFSETAVFTSVPINRTYYIYVKNHTDRNAGGDVFYGTGMSMTVSLGTTYTATPPEGNGIYWNVCKVVGGRIIPRGTISAEPETSY